MELAGTTLEAADAEADGGLESENADTPDATLLLPGTRLTMAYRKIETYFELTTNQTNDNIRVR